MKRIHSIPVALAAAALLLSAPVHAQTPNPPASPPPATPDATPGAAAATPPETTTPPAATPAPDANAPAATVEQAPTKTESPLKSLMVGLRIGATVPQPFNKLDANFLGEVELAYQFPVLQKRLGVFLDVGYTQPTRSATNTDARVPGGNVTYDETVRDVGFTLGLHYWHPVTNKFLVYGGAGARLHLTHTLINATSTDPTTGTVQQYGENTEDSTRVGAMLRVGAGYVLGPGAIVFEVHFEWTGINHLITGGEREGESANTANLAFQLGYQFFLL